MTGYYPILYVALNEKAMALRSGGNLDAAYRGKTVFKPGLATRAGAGALQAAAEISKGLDRQLDRMTKRPAATATAADVHVDDLGCRPRYSHYCASVRHGIQFALDHGKAVLVVTQPYNGDIHREQQADLRTMLAARYGRNPRVRYANLGEAIDLLHDTTNVYDTMHLTRDGNALVARLLAGPVAALMPEAFNAPSSDAANRSAR